MTAEEKVLEKIRKVLVADTTLKGYVCARVYASHISSIDEPKYPAISMHMFPSAEDFSASDYIRMIVQLDIWAHGTTHTQSDMYAMLERLRALLHRTNLNDTTIGLVVAESIEIPGSPLLRDPETDLLHLPTRYRVVAK